MAEEQARRGTLIVVVGPSGAGKDSVMNIAARHFAGRKDIHFARRFITRPQDAGGEAHQSVSDSEFELLQASGGFSVSWDAHDLRYGIPCDALARVERGETVIVNGSRRALCDFAKAFARITVVNITAAPEVLAERLMARGRESEADIRARLARQVPALAEQPGIVVIDNSGRLEDAAWQFIAVAEAIAAGRPG
ncbi:phosphonate metabolism protein/1,5-bisphosphokinase (PRPP-forming) PhnN [Pararhizobium sp.]|uniref:phosphonate metabolism protein/1,5-bisphosphokinase (PRPP-forming) PhnN n=1 Tax=Pararhizobium sp. TaxID=1977563 RepID=UPI00271D530B|nr:phosphonate metabolism protein/1,5-bisphosphokinase (PRPP-forming) PhnN [Pararhizobium sp.]MDO9415935.1 phosphonate metabolism protein/1,5-bisphosphokinase (PRPP-forming) PhnN [Pararhizobium sp.]